MTDQSPEETRGEVRLVAIDSGLAQAIEDLLADGRVDAHGEPEWMNWRKKWDAGITEEDVRDLARSLPLVIGPKGEAAYAKLRDSFPDDQGGVK